IRDKLVTGVQTCALPIFITPSLSFMAEATSDAGIRSFGVAYGLYNLAWGAGLLAGPALGGFLFERMGFARLLLAWSPPLALVIEIGRASCRERGWSSVVA